MGCPARANSDSFRQAVQLSVVCEQDDAACLLARTLKRHRVVAMNIALAGISAMRLESWGVGWI